MKTDHKKKVTTLGEFIMCVYDACDEKNAGAVVWLAIRARLVMFHRHSSRVIV